MKKLLLISALFLVVMYPSMVLAGNVYLNSSATLYSEPNKLPKAKGDATIACKTISPREHEWTINANFSGLLKNKPYIFQISAQDQLWIKYDIDVTSDRSGNINLIDYKTTKLDTQYQEFGPYRNNLWYFLPNISYSAYDAANGYSGYTILRLLDLSGASGGIKLTSLEPTSATNPYLLDNNGDGLPDSPKATMVMRAREDGYRADLKFTP